MTPKNAPLGAPVPAPAQGEGANPETPPATRAARLPGSPDALQTPPGERSPAGRVFADLAHRLHRAAREGDRPRVDALLALTEALEAEFPAEIEREKAFWR